MMRFRLARLALCLALATIVLCQVPAQEPEINDMLRVDTTLVSVPVIVSDRQGRYVADLKVDDFRLWQDGIRQTIAFFAATEEPINVALLLDTSRSTKEVLGKIRKAGTAFIRQLRPQDRALVIAFDYDVHLLCPLTGDGRRLERAIRQAEVGRQFGTTLRDAVIEVTARQFRDVNGRKAIILLTDGKDVGSQISTRELMESVEESDTMIYPVFYATGPLDGFRMRRRFPFPMPGRRGRRFPLVRQFSSPQIGMGRINRQAEEFLEGLAEASAGRYHRSEVDDLEGTFALIVEELRHQYRLGFYPEDSRPGVLHQLRVEVSRPDVSVRARRSYRLPRRALP